MKYSEIEPNTAFLIGVMCKMVDCDYETFDFVDDWYDKFEWTQAEKDHYQDWLVDELYANKKLRQHFGIWSKNKKTLRREADAFIFNYGWRIKE